MSCPARYEATVSLMVVYSSFQRAMVDHSNPGYGPDGSGNRPVRTRLLGWCGGWGRKTPGYPIGIGHSFTNLSSNKSSALRLESITDKTKTVVSVIR